MKTPLPTAVVPLLLVCAPTMAAEPTPVSADAPALSTVEVVGPTESGA